MTGSITLNKASGGQLTLTPEDGTSTETLSLTPTGFPKQSGEILQVVRYGIDSAGEWVNTTNVFADTPLSVTITPKSATSILIATAIFNGKHQTGASNDGAVWRFTRDGSQVTNNSADQFNYSDGNLSGWGTANKHFPVAMALDVISGSTTATTIKVQGRCFDSGTTVMSLDWGYSYFQVMEVAA